MNSSEKPMPAVRPRHKRAGNRERIVEAASELQSDPRLRRIGPVTGIDAIPDQESSDARPRFY